MVGQHGSDKHHWVFGPGPRLPWRRALCGVRQSFEACQMESRSRGSFSGAAQQIRFRLVDDCWLQTSTVRLQATMNNLAVNTTGQGGAVVPGPVISPIADPLAMFSSARLYMGGQLVEDIQELGPLAVMLDYFKPLNRRINDSMMNHPLATNADPRTNLRAQRSRRIIVELPFGMLKQRLWLPLHLTSQLVVEVTLGPATRPCPLWPARV